MRTFDMLLLFINSIMPVAIDCVHYFYIWGASLFISDIIEIVSKFVFYV